MNITVKLTRKENLAHYGDGPITLDMEEYLCGVVPAELYDSSAPDALKAQAIAARTYAVRRVLDGSGVDDTASTQAFRVSRINSPNSRRAVRDTAEQVLCHEGKVIYCYYSASNGGETKRSGDVWSKHFPYYVNKADAWDKAANAEKATKASHGIGLSQIGTMWAGKNGIPYTDILAFYYDGTVIIGGYGEGAPITEGEAPSGETAAPPAETPAASALDITVQYMTNNDCYNAGRKITPTGIMVHSTASPGVMAASWFKRWNLSYKKGETSRQVCVHAFLDDKGVWQYLPWNHRGWHAGGTANNSMIGFEICEPSGHSYGSGGKMLNYDPVKKEAYFRAVWRNSIELCAMLCAMYNIDPMNIISHYEGAKKGMASNHADPGQWFPKHGESMDTFRAAVKARLAGGPVVSQPGTGESINNSRRYTVKPGDTLWGIARAQLGSGARYKEIMALNGLASDRIAAGMTLTLP